MNRINTMLRNTGVGAVTGLFGIVALVPLAGLFGPVARGPFPALPTSPSTTAADPAPADFVGHWQGDLDVGGTSLRLVFHIEASEDGGLAATLDSPDQGATGIPVETVTVKGDSLRLDIAAASAVYVGRLTAEGQTIEGEWRQGGTTLPLTVERVDEVEKRPRPQDPEPPLPYAEETVRIDVPGADVTLEGTLTLPPGDGPVPAVVLVSGSGPQDRDETVAGHRPFLVLADHLTRRGVAVLRTDDRGVGGSTGSTFRSTMDDRARDVLAAVRFLGERPGIDRQRIGLLGHSEGGWVAPLAATEAPDEIAFAVLMAGPGQSPRDLMLSQQRTLLTAQGSEDAEIAAREAFLEGNFDIILASPDTATARTRLLERRARILTELPDAQRRALETYFEEQTDAERDQALRLANSAWFRDLLAFDAASSLRAMEQPVLALLGTKDVQVPADENAPLLAGLLNADARPDREVRVLPGLNHLFQPSETGLPSEYAAIDTTMSAAALEAVGGWITAVVGR
jgi:pimeloyl-ACP methyl ester carboxylesterase